MAFNVRETIHGLNHLRLRFCRKWLKQPAGRFLPGYVDGSGAVEFSAALAQSGEQLECPRCGFALVRARFANGWHLEMCSALPIVNPGDTRFMRWLEALADEGLEGTPAIDAQAEEPLTI